MPIAQKIAIQALKDIQRNHLGLNDALKQADLDQLHYYAHSLKGVASLLKCHQLSVCAQEIEALAKDQMLQEAIRRAPELALQIERATTALDNFIAVNEAIKNNPRQLSSES